MSLPRKMRRTTVAYGPQVALDVDEAAARVAVQHPGCIAHAGILANLLPESSWER